MAVTPLAEKQEHLRRGLTVRLFWEKCFLDNSESVLAVVLYWLKFRSCPFAFFYWFGWFLAFSSFPSGVICNRTKWGIILWWFKHLVEQRWERGYKRKGGSWAKEEWRLGWVNTKLLTGNQVCLVWSFCHVGSNSLSILLRILCGDGAFPHSVCSCYRLPRYTDRQLRWRRVINQVWSSWQELQIIQDFHTRVWTKNIQVMLRSITE